MDIMLFVPEVCITASMGKVHAWISHVLCQGIVVVRTPVMPATRIQIGFKC